MTFGTCPECGKRVSRTLLRVVCEKCSIVLKDAPSTKALKIAVHFSFYIGAAYLAIDGTSEIIESNPENAKDVLFWYYNKLFFGALFLSVLINVGIRQYFSFYERGKNDT